MKIVINGCYGGFSLSPKALKRWAELDGRECYFFKHGNDDSGHLSLSAPYVAISEPSDDSLFWTAFDTPTPPEPSGAKWFEMTDAEKKAANANWESHHIYPRDIDRTDPKLIQVIQELGDSASGRCGELKIVEIPDGVEWEIEEYDGIEWVSEKHRTWR